MANKYLLSFIIGSSLISCLVTFAYTGFAFHKANHTFDDVEPLHYELVPFLIPIVLGFGNVLNFWLRNNIGKGIPRWFATGLGGGITGLILSIIGRFGFNLPTKIFDFEEENQHYVHVYAFGLYILIFSFIIQPLNSFFL